jgi:hypothetical protein
LEKACHTQRRDGPSFGRLYHVPKKDLVAALEVPFDTEKLKIADGLKVWLVLKQELQGFRCEQNPKTAHVSFEYWRDSDHDDLVLAVAIDGPSGSRFARRAGG